MLPIQKISHNYIFYGSAAVTLISLVIAILIKDPLPLLLPLAIASAMIITAQFKGIYFILLSLLVLSVDIQLPNGLGLDFPSEPLMMTFMLISILFFIPNYKKLDKSFFNHPLFLFLLAHLVWIAITTIFSSYITLSFKFFLAKLWYVASFVIMGGYFIKDSKDFERAFWYILIPMIAVITWVLYNFFNYNFDFAFVNKTMNPIYINHVDYGVAIAIFMPFCILFRKWYKSGSIARMLIHLGIILIILGVIFSYTRAAYISLLIIPLAWCVFKFKLVKIGVVSSLIVAMLGLGYLAHDNNYIDYAPDFDTTIFHTDFADHLGATVQLKDLSTMERVYRWVAGARMWQEHPYLGFGPSTFTRHYRKYTSILFETYVSENEENSTTHNYFLMTLVEQGVLGFIIFLSLCIAIFIYGEKVYHKLINQKDKQVVMAVLISALLIVANIMMADLIETDEIGTMFFLYIAVLINFDLKANKDIKALNN